MNGLFFLNGIKRRGVKKDEKLNAGKVPIQKKIMATVLCIGFSSNTLPKRALYKNPQGNKTEKKPTIIAGYR